MRYALTAEQAEKVLSTGRSGVARDPSWQRALFERAVAPLWQLLLADGAARGEGLTRAVEEWAARLPCDDQEAFLDAMDVPFAEEVGPVESGCRCRYCEGAGGRLADERRVPRPERLRQAFVAALDAHLRLAVPSRATTTAWAGQPRLEWHGRRSYRHTRTAQERAASIAASLGFPPPPPLPAVDPFARSVIPAWIYAASTDRRLGGYPWQPAPARRGPPPTPEELAERSRRAEAAAHWLAARHALSTVYHEHARAIWSLVTRGLERFESPFPRCYRRQVEQRIAPVAAHIACTAIPLADQAAALAAAGMLPAGVPLGAVPGCRCQRCQTEQEGPDPLATPAAAVVPWFVLRLADMLRARFDNPAGEDLARGMPMPVRRLYWDRRRDHGNAS